MLVNNPKAEEEKFSVSIESQFNEKGNIFYAEGNVVIYLSMQGSKRNNYDKAKKQFVIQDNVKYKKVLNILKPQKKFFDFAKDKGYIEIFMAF